MGAGLSEVDACRTGDAARLKTMSGLKACLVRLGIDQIDQSEGNVGRSLGQAGAEGGHDVRPGNGRG